MGLGFGQQLLDRLPHLPTPIVHVAVGVADDLGLRP